MADTDLPNLLYLGDVPVEASHHGSALLYRLLEHYPPHRLRIIESGEASVAERRLPGVNYAAAPIGRRRWLNTRLHGLYSAWLSYTAPGRAGYASALTADFPAAAIMTVGHGNGWLLAAKLAAQRGVPLHLIMHDDWPRLAGIARFRAGWLERRFADVYRQAHTRLCVSPFMAEEYERRYGVGGSVLYPSRSSTCPVFAAKPPRPIEAGGEIVLGYGGNSGPEMMACLKDLAGALDGINARVLVFGPFGASEQQALTAISPSFTFLGLVPYQEMIARLRAEADVLFVPMAFDEAARDNMVVSFPSKLADYTAVGVPILIYGPPYCSAVRWARLFAPVAEVVDTAGSARLAVVLDELKRDSARRWRLSERALAVGADCFSSAAGQNRLYAALGRPCRNGSGPGPAA